METNSALLPALKQAHKGNRLNCSRTQHPPQPGTWGGGVGTEQWRRQMWNKYKNMDQEGKQRDFSLCYVEGAELQLRDHCSVNSKVLCITRNKRKLLISVCLRACYQQANQKMCCRLATTSTTQDTAWCCTGSKRKALEEQQKF